MRTTRLMLAGAGLATVALLASSGIANAAATINGPSYNRTTAGYEITGSPNGEAVTFNEVRGTLTVPAGSTTDGVVALQSTVLGGVTVALRAHFAAEGTSEGDFFHTTALQSGWFLQASVSQVANGQNGVFNTSPQPHLVWFNVPSLQADAGSPLFQVNTGGSVYLEVHYSTHLRQIAFLAGPSEVNTEELVNLPTQLVKLLTFPSSLGKISFDAPAVETWNGDAADLGLNQPELKWTRVGVTQPAGFNDGGKAGTRVTFDFFNTMQSLATFNGGAPGVTNPLTLVTSPSFPTVGSGYGAIGGAL